MDCAAAPLLPAAAAAAAAQVTSYPRGTPADAAWLAEVAALQAAAAAAEAAANTAGADDDSFRFEGSAYNCIEHANWPPQTAGSDLAYAAVARLPTSFAAETWRSSLR